MAEKKAMRRVGWCRFAAASPDAERLLPVFVDLMTVKPSWAAGLPTKVDAHISNRFG
jgi:hypothetical protein